ncbi:PREDICTED: dedicator of cytokinesis protein 7-like [Acropora digitifera]|uniref:dedicator of cytokinesis protein 7-like n=1 Tax=Acropora digitifera TaxID=70779 RepID=UPI00077AD34E|nr:PREDICTED: dedicator of cytokinesis protein 7-like [Acropora digitifera]
MHSSDDGDYSLNVCVCRIENNPQLKDCIHCYSADWAIVNRRYQFRCSDEGKPDSRRKIVRSPSFVKSLPVQVYEIDEKGKLSEQGKSASQLKLNQVKQYFILWTDFLFLKKLWYCISLKLFPCSIFDLQSCSPDPLLPSVLERTPAEEVDLANEEDRGLFRIHSLFSIYSVQQEEGIERRIPATIPQEHFGQRILVKCLQLKLELEVEPIFASMALYDGKVKKKISENFYFDMNSEWCRKLVKDHNSLMDISTLSRSGIFSITYPSSDVFLVIKLEKVLQQGDIGDCAEPYTKDTENPKQSSMSDTQTASVRSSRSSMYEARKSVHLTDVAEYEVVPDLTNFRPVTLTVSSFFKQETDKLKDDDLYKFLADLKRPSSVLKRLKCIPVHVFIFRNLLYVYPLSVNYTSRSSSARNIAVKVEFLAGEEVAPLECLFGKSSTSAMQSEAWSAVTYHNKTPDFYEEVKVKLPAHLTVEHHLLFTFYHISCSAGKKADDKMATETPIGYTVPLPGMKWLEGHKGVFHVAVRAVSSIHPQDLHIQKFLKTCHQIEGRVTSSPNRTAEGNLESALRKSIVDLCKAREEPLVRFLYLVLDKLILLLVRPPIISGTVVNIGQAAFESLTQIVDRLHQLLENSQDEHGRNQLLSSYITYVFSAPYSHSPTSSPDHRSGHREPGRSASIPVGLQSKPRQKLSSSNPQLNATLTNEKPELLGCWEDDGEEITCEGSNMPGNRNSMAEGRSNTLGAPRMSQSTSTNSRKLVHEELGLQWAVGSGPLKEKAMAHAWFFFELMVKSMAQHLENTDKFFWTRKSRFPEQFLGDIRAMVNSTVYEIATKIEASENRFSLISSLNNYTSTIWKRPALLFFPECRFEMTKTIVLIPCSVARQMLYQSTIVPEASQLRLEFLRIVCSHEHYVTLNLPFPSPLYPSPPISPTNSVSSIASSASAYTVIIGNSVAELSTAFRGQHFLAGLVLSELALALEGGEMTLINQAIDTTRDLIAGHDSDTRYDEVPCRSAVAALYLPIVGLVIGALQQLHGYGSGENSSITPDVAMAIATSSIMGGLAVEENKGDLSSQKSKPQQFSPETTRNLLVCFLWVLKNVDSEVLKDWWSDQPASRLGLLLDVLRLCVSLFEYSGKVQKSSQNPTAPRPKAQQEMKAKLEEMMLGNKGAAKEMMQRHSRVMLEKGQSPSSESRLRWRKDQTQWRQAADQLDRLRPEAEVTSQIEGSLAAEVSSIVLDSLEHLVQTVTTSDSLRVVLSGILRVLLHCLNCNQSEIVLQNMFATQRSIVYKFPELLFEDDTELCADLCSRLLNHCSSAISSIRAQASSSLYLLMRQNYLLFSLQVRELVFNLHMILSDTVKMKEYQEDPEMLIDLMYRIAKGRDYKKLTVVHKKLSEAFGKIIQTEGKRMLGTYFRVGFYGSKFGDLDGEEYIYKEPAITKLPEVSHRLQAFYGAKFGEDVVEVIKDSNAVEQDKLEPEKAYIQLTYVDPYFDEYELKDRITYFDKNFNLRRFKYDTPFTPSGKAHGELVTQYKRKTILTTANSFPYVKTRINVVHREQIVLSPIEVAIEDMEVRTKDLVNAVQQEPPDAKMLQMVLQGSIGATVNQGPLEIALVFLCQGQESNEEGESQMFTRHHHRLRLSFKEFVKRCGDALQKNKHLITLDQRAYQKELERNYTKLTEKLEPLLKNKFGSLRGSMRQKEGSALLRKISMSFSAGHSVA